MNKQTKPTALKEISYKGYDIYTTDTGGVSIWLGDELIKDFPDGDIRAAKDLVESIQSNEYKADSPPAEDQDSSHVNKAPDPLAVEYPPEVLDLIDAIKKHHRSVLNHDAEIMNLKKWCLAAAIRCGESLIELKDKIPSGQFGSCVKEHFGKSPCHLTCNRYMKLARNKLSIQDCPSIRRAYITLDMIEEKILLETEFEDVSVEHQILNDENIPDEIGEHDNPLGPSVVPPVVKDEPTTTPRKKREPKPVREESEFVLLYKPSTDERRPLIEFVLEPHGKFVGYNHETGEPYLSPDNGKQVCLEKLPDDFYQALKTLMEKVETNGTLEDHKTDAVSLEDEQKIAA